MNDEIKQAAEKYIENTQINFEFSIMGESVEVPELFKNWCIEGIKHGYIQGSNYAIEKCQEEIKSLKEDLKELIEQIESHPDYSCIDQYPAIAIKQRYNL